MAKLRVDRKRLVDWASRAISIPSFTGSEQDMATLMAETFDEMGLHVQWQQVEHGRANVLGIRSGGGGGPSLMFNGHLDTSYSGQEPWLRGVRGFQPSPFAVSSGSRFRARAIGPPKAPRWRIITAAAKIPSSAATMNAPRQPTMPCSTSKAGGATADPSIPAKV